MLSQKEQVIFDKLKQKAIEKYGEIIPSTKGELYQTTYGVTRMYFWYDDIFGSSHVETEIINKTE